MKFVKDTTPEKLFSKTCTIELTVTELLYLTGLMGNSCEEDDDAATKLVQTAFHFDYVPLPNNTDDLYADFCDVVKTMTGHQRE